MPSTSADTMPVESPKKVQKEEKDGVEEKQVDGVSKNGTNTLNNSEDAKEDEPIDEKESTEVDNEKLAEEAASLLAQGKRHLFVKDYPSAVNTLGDACGKFSELYGELGDECADAYFNYGCALLELAREESGVLDVENKDKESEDSEEGDAEEEVDENDEKNNENEKKETDSIIQKTDDEKSTDNKTEETENVTEDKTKEDGDDANGNEGEEDVNNLQLAWEMFELAKVIFNRKSDEKNLADTYLKLGEVALESENYETAITDIQSCLDLQHKILPPISREIAETLYQLGLACSLCNQFDNAIKHFTAAGVILEKRVITLNSMTEPEPEKAKNPFYSINKEIDEIRALLPEIKDKIADMEEFKNETMKAVVQATINNTVKVSADGAGPSTNGTSSSSAASTSSKAPANDISHLIRKKRKTPDDDSVSSSEAKKHCDETKST